MPLLRHLLQAVWPGCTKHLILSFLHSAPAIKHNSMSFTDSEERSKVTPCDNSLHTGSCHVRLRGNCVGACSQAIRDIAVGTVSCPLVAVHVHQLLCRCHTVAAIFCITRWGLCVGKNAGGSRGEGAEEMRWRDRPPFMNQLLHCTNIEPLIL